MLWWWVECNRERKEGWMYRIEAEQCYHNKELLFPLSKTRILFILREHNIWTIQITICDVYATGQWEAYVNMHALNGMSVCNTLDSQYTLLQHDNKKKNICLFSVMHRAVHVTNKMLTHVYLRLQKRMYKILLYYITHTSASPSNTSGLSPTVRTMHCKNSLSS